MDWLNIWIGTFTKRVKRKYTMMDGIKSVVFASLIFGALNFVISLMNTDDAANAFAGNMIVLPILCVVCLAIFAGVFRWVAGMYSGKGKFQSDIAVIGVHMGSLIVVAGAIVIVFGIMMAFFFPATLTETTVDVNFFSMFMVVGLMSAIMIYLFATVFGVWLEELASVEKLSVTATAKVFGAASAIIVFVAALVFGGLLELALGPYKEAIAQYGATYTTTGA
jgi:hypothetical protein